MKKIILSVILLAGISPYFLGKLQYNNAVSVIQNLGDEDTGFLSSDQDIENVLRVFDFNITAQDHPNFFDYYTSGYKTIF